jgi:hypothetical protein
MLLPLLLLPLGRLSKAERLMNLLLSNRTNTALLGWKAQTTSTSDTASSQHSGREQRIPAKFQLNGDYYVGQMANIPQLIY